MSDLEDFDAYDQLADQLMGVATKEQVAEAARLLAMNLAHYQLRYGELPLRDFEAMMRAQAPDEEMQAILARGVEALVGVLGIVLELRNDTH